MSRVDQTRHFAPSGAIKAMIGKAKTMSTSAALILLALASPAAAQDRHAWGWNGIAYLALAPATGGPVATLTFQNERVDGITETKVITLAIDGLVVEVTALLGRGMTDDEISVTVPDGFMAIPDMLIVPEEASQTLEIWPMDAVPLG
jgi:hypothetical protein